MNLRSDRFCTTRTDYFLGLPLRYACLASPPLLVARQGHTLKFLATQGQRADGGTRTHDLLITNQLLCQLNYIGNPLAKGIEVVQIPIGHRTAGVLVVVVVVSLVG